MAVPRPPTQCVALRLLAAVLLLAGPPGPAAGAGFFVTADGYFITATAQLAAEGPVLIRDAEGGSHPAAVVAFDPGGGLALLKAEGVFSPIPIAATESLAAGDPLFAPLPERGDAAAAPRQARVIAAGGASGFRFALGGGAAEPGAPLLDARGNAVGVAAEREGHAIGSGPLRALIAAVQPALAQLPPPGAGVPGEEAVSGLGRVVVATPEPAANAGPDQGALLAAEMFRIGSRARLGRDYAAALAWLGGAAGLGHAGAQLALGEMHEEGEGVAADAAQAARWYRAAARDEPQAQVRLGWLHAEGRGLPRDDDAALAWFRRAAETGSAAGQDALGVMYRDGRGVYRDDARAAEWFRLAALQGDAAAQEHLGALFREGRGVERDEAEAAWWLRRAAEQGRAGAQHSLALLYREGRGVPRDEAEALRWLRRAAAQGHAPAARLLEAVAEGRGPDAPRISGTLR